MNNETDEDFAMKVYDGPTEIQGQMFLAKSSHRMEFMNEYVERHKDPWIKVVNRYDEVIVEAKLNVQ